MAVRPVLTYPDERLRTIAAPVEIIDDALRQLAADMLETMSAESGLGLAATQVDVHLRLFVIDLRNPEAESDPEPEPEFGPMVLINPRIISREGALPWVEGCLSVPGVRAEVIRSARVEVGAWDLEGEAFELEVEGLAAVCVQHELDHLEGRLFVDHLGPLERKAVLEGLSTVRGSE